MARLLRFLPVLLLLLPAPAGANRLQQRLGRNESRVVSAPFALRPGRTVVQMQLARRLERLGYRRVKQRPELAGQYFWGHEVFWIFRREFREGGHDHRARLLGLRLRREDGRVLGLLGADGEPDPDDRHWRLEPELLSESLTGDRARRIPVSLEKLPEHVWRAVLAAEDSRFFDHPGLDARSLARATVANLRAGEVVQGGSTLTQQLIKNRDLTPRRSLGRKASEAIRALALEEEFTKEEILETYLSYVYLGHVDGLAVHGFGTATRVYFSEDSSDLDLGQAAALAAVIQGPNRLSPLRHPEAVRERRDWILGRMEELGWASAREVARAKSGPVRTRFTAPEPPPAPHFLSWVEQVTREDAPRWREKGRGIVAETTLDPLLQEMAESSVAEGLAELRRRYPQLGRSPLGAALVVLEARTGAVLAYVGAEPGAAGDHFDRVRQAARQPGSSIKPLLLLEAFESCGERAPLHPATRIADEPIRLDLPSGPWEPENPDRTFRGTVTVREALVKSLNVPFVRLARWCGFEDTAETLRRSGVPVPADPPPSFSLGAVELSPLQLASAYTAVAAEGRRREPLPVRRLERPGGRRLHRGRERERRVSGPGAAYLVHDLLREAVERGTAASVAVPGLELAAKTGTSSKARDAWLVGYGGAIVSAVWVGRDDGQPLGLAGSIAAAPIWRRFMAEAVPALPDPGRLRPSSVVERWIDSATGLLVSRHNERRQRELFRREALPPRDRFWRRDEPVPVIR